MDNTIKRPITLRELGDLSENLKLPIQETWSLLTNALGEEWWEHDHHEVTLALGSTPSLAAPAGYELAEGCSDHWTGREIMNRGWIVNQAWNSTTGQSTIELWVADHEAPSYGNLTPADAINLATDLLALAKESIAATPTGITPEDEEEN